MKPEGEREASSREALLCGLSNWSSPLCDTGRLTVWGLLASAPHTNPPLQGVCELGFCPSPQRPKPTTWLSSAPSRHEVLPGTTSDWRVPRGSPLPFPGCCQGRRMGPALSALITQKPGESNPGSRSGFFCSRPPKRAGLRMVTEDHLRTCKVGQCDSVPSQDDRRPEREGTRQAQDCLAFPRAARYSQPCHPAPQLASVLDL